MSEQAKRARGRQGGRKPKLTAEQAAEARGHWAAGTMTLREIGDLFGGIAPSTVYGYVKPQVNQEEK